MEALTSFLQDWRPLSNGRDTFKWLLSPDGEFSVAHLKTLIEEKLLMADTREVETSWSRNIPKKFGILIWRVRLGRIACRDVLNNMGIDVDSLLCPRCNNEVETIEHALFRCEEVRRLWSLLARWWDMDIGGSIKTISELLHLGSTTTGSSSVLKLWQETIWAFTYLLWANRNQLIFSKGNTRVQDLFGDFQRRSYEWIEGRIRKKRIE